MSRGWIAIGGSNVAVCGADFGANFVFSVGGVLTY